MGDDHELRLNARFLDEVGEAGCPKSTPYFGANPLTSSGQVLGRETVLRIHRELAFRDHARSILTQSRPSLLRAPFPLCGFFYQGWNGEVPLAMRTLPRRLKPLVVVAFMQR